MTKEEMLAVKAAIEAMPHLHSARHNKDYETMASVVNEDRAADAKLTTLDVHACMAAGTE
jgi:hypothetical protein